MGNPATLRSDFMGGTIRVAGGAGTVTSQSGQWSAAMTKNGTGDYALTVEPGMDVDEFALIVSIEGSTPLISSIVHTSDTAKQVLLEDDAGAATDATFKVTAFRYK